MWHTYCQMTNKQTTKIQDHVVKARLKLIDLAVILQTYKIIIMVYGDNTWSPQIQSMSLLEEALYKNAT